MAVPEILMLTGEFRTIPSPEGARVGLISYQWGFALRSDDSCFANSNLSLGPIHSRSSGCGGCRAYRRGTNGVDALTNSWIAGSGYTESYPTLGADWITPTPISMLDGNPSSNVAAVKSGDCKCRTRPPQSNSELLKCTPLRRT